MLSFNEVFDSLKEDLVLGKEVKFFPNGRSMFPTIVEKRDYVYLSKTSFKVLDIIFYKVEDKYLLHRVIKIDGDKIICQGDNNLVKEVITKDDRRKYSKRQIKAIKYCNNLEVELYNADYLTKDIESEKNNKYHNISQQKYLTSKSVQSVCVGVVTSFVFAYLIVSLASDISWANLFYSLIKVITWLASGVMALVGAYVFVTQTYKAVLRDKTLKLKEYIKWKNEQSMRKDEQSNKTND